MWVVVFIALHVYWALGGTFGFGDATETEPKVDSPAKWVFTIVVDIMFLVGAFIPLALYHEWGKRIPAWMLACCCWIGTAILVLRGFSGLLDTALRGTGLARNGLTGLTYQQELGVEHPSVLHVCGPQARSTCTSRSAASSSSWPRSPTTGPSAVRTQPRDLRR